MNRIYDIFEKTDDGLVWRAVIPGYEAAMRRLQELAEQSSNEFQVKHLESDTVVATINAPKVESDG